MVGCDFSEEMLERARRKEPSVEFEWADALGPYEDDSFDAATVGFGARNFSDLERGLAEMARVVRPAAGWWCSRSPRPQKPPLSTFFSLWFDRVVPALGRMAGDEAAYSYLPNSVKRFPDPHALAASWPRGARGHPLGPDRGRHHRDPRGYRLAVTTGNTSAVWRACWRRAAPSCRAT